jgi:DNA-3-methyladenine glycosylase I
MSAYCKNAEQTPHHKSYHDTEYGFPADDETVLFERLALEIMQAGLSWDLILKKRASMNKAFHGFRVNKVVNYKSADIKRLLADPGTIRNRLKIEAIIHNAAVVQGMRKSHQGFAGWLAAHHPRTKVEWVKLFKKTFRFTGGEIVGEFLMSLGYLPLCHAPDCKIGKRLLKRHLPWKKAEKEGFAY